MILKNLSIKKMMKRRLLMNNRAKGIFHILIAALCFSLMSFFVKLSGDLPTMQKAFFRNAVAAVIAVYLLARSEGGFYIKKSSWPSLLCRCGFGTAGLIANFWAIDHMAVADANMLNKMSPFFAIIMSVFILKEIPSRFEVICVIIAFTGAMFVVKPTAGIASFPALVGLFGGFGAGTAYTYVRKLGKQGERGPVIVMCFSVFSTLVTLPFFIMGYEPMTVSQFLCLLAAGSVAAIAQLNITAAYTYAPAKEISVFDYTQVLFAAMWGGIFLDELPDVYSFIGYAIIIGIAVIKWYVGRKQ